MLKNRNNWTELYEDTIYQKKNCADLKLIWYVLARYASFLTVRDIEYNGFAVMTTSSNENCQYFVLIVEQLLLFLFVCNAVLLAEHEVCCSLRCSAIVGRDVFRYHSDWTFFLRHCLLPIWSFLVLCLFMEGIRHSNFNLQVFGDTAGF